MTSFTDIHESRGGKMVDCNGKSIAYTVADFATAYRALRENFIVADYSHYAIIEVSGDNAFEFLDRVVVGDLGAIRDEQALYTLVLDQAGQIVADLYVLCDDERFLVMTEMISGLELISILTAEVREEENVKVVDLTDRLTAVLFEGPYSWEICKEIFGIDVIGLPYMEHMRFGDAIVFRAGKHGEFSYKVLCEAKTARQLLQDPEDLYSKYNAAFVGLDFQNFARLENPCWDSNRLGVASRCPIELQLQWMVRYDKEEFMGKEALQKRLTEGVSRRLVGFVCEDEGQRDIELGSRVFAADSEIGSVVISGFSPKREKVIGQVLLDADYAYADISGYFIVSKGENIAIDTSAIPFINNVSFLVDPAEHSYIDSSRSKNMLEQFAASDIESTIETA